MIIVSPVTSKGCCVKITVNRKKGKWKGEKRGKRKKTFTNAKNCEVSCVISSVCVASSSDSMEQTLLAISSSWIAFCRGRKEDKWKRKLKKEFLSFTLFHTSIVIFVRFMLSSYSKYSLKITNTCEEAKWGREKKTCSTPFNIVIGFSSITPNYFVFWSKTTDAMIKVREGWMAQSCKRQNSNFLSLAPVHPLVYGYLPHLHGNHMITMLYLNCLINCTSAQDERKSENMSNLIFTFISPILTYSHLSRFL